MDDSSISTHDRHQDLRARVNPRRNQSPFSRRSSIDSVGIVPSNYDHMQGYPAVEIAPPPPLRTPIVHGNFIKLLFVFLTVSLQKAVPKSYQLLYLLCCSWYYNFFKNLIHNISKLY